jgi:predicted nucleic acid-binding protein
MGITGKVGGATAKHLLAHGEEVRALVKRHPITRITFSASTHPSRKLSQRVSIVSLDHVELELFFDIVGAPAQDALGDGEAAAIAVAASRGLDLVIDDKKARQIVKERFGRVRVYWTVDVLHADSVIAALGHHQIDECSAKALRYGRMHVPRA